MHLRERKYLMESGTLFSTSGTLEGIKQTISEFYYGATVELKQISEKEWSVSTGKGLIKKVHVIKKGKRFRFQAR